MKEQKTYQFKFTVVTPVYNVEEYLEETLESVLSQTIGFEENIQMILVNDGSPDNSEEICLKYQKKYPDNIIYLKKENGGVSSARNEAFPYIQGKYVNFLDSDDKWAPDAFALVYPFFEKNQNKTDVVGARKRFFEGRNDYHHLDYKFETTKVVYLQTQYDYVQLDVTSSFVKAEVLERHRFCTKLKYGEDSAFINEVLLEKCTLGLVREAVHFYRKRRNETSALQNELKSDSYYLDSPEYYHKALIEKSLEQYGKVPEFIQYAVMYDLGWRIRKDIRSYVTDERAESYKKHIQEILQYIEERVIMNQRIMYKDAMIYALSLKYGRDIRKEIIYDMGKLLFHNIELLNLSQTSNIIILTSMEVKDQTVCLEGRVNTWLPEEDYEIYTEIKGKRSPLPCFDLKEFDKMGLDGVCHKGRGFRLEIPVGKKEWDLTFSIWYRDIYRKKVRFALDSSVPLNEEETSYYYQSFCLLRKDKKKLICKHMGRRERLEYEKAYQSALIQAGRKDLLPFRKWYMVLKELKKKEIWLAADNLSQCQEPSAPVFQYLSEQRKAGTRIYFVSEKSCPVAKEAGKYGKILAYGSFRHKILFLLSDKIIVSGKHKDEMDVFGEQGTYMKDLYQFETVFWSET